MIENPFTISNLELLFQLGGIPCIFQECSDQFTRLTEETLPSHVAARHPEVKTVLGGGPHQVSNLKRNDRLKNSCTPAVEKQNPVATEE